MKIYNCGPYPNFWSPPATDYKKAMDSAGQYAESIEVIDTTLSDGQAAHYILIKFEEEGLLVYKIVNPKHANYILEYEILQQEASAS